LGLRTAKNEEAVVTDITIDDRIAARLKLVAAPQAPGTASFELRDE
jgi:hypothetical protein